MATLKVRKIGNSYGIILPKEVMDKLKVGEGDMLYIVDSPVGYNITSFDPEFEDSMSAFEETYRQYRNAFKELAK